ncbi:UDP-N-acetylglucosamine 4,6-dehydratase [Candidatus Syntrophocurvum alkaliphilum]|uniref:UDP-N-acetylglucosamine 4,6-dehydratase n=1 Tax=Candidatus Syntrophocurvum alkaliphilum TaxID=2293317 RepID=A0A6I6DH80_9FIRM|nr:polysaccharide biosynthesis protein [Candidatus Syntrophocurvum alkaliphilum]QGU00163.1 UDP-N-acetylglucosamine 4,6-dehydratase [Candidatus Syntrophocurvum alkaliphilum]
MSLFKNKVVLITGGTGSLGKVLTRRLLSNPNDLPKKIIIFSRDEAKQHAMRVDYKQKIQATDEIIYEDFKKLVEFRIGDIRNYHSVCAALDGVNIVINTAALKQVPTCEYFPYEAVQTNIGGAENIVRAIRENKLTIDTVVGVSTDKACKPINVMGMTKAIQERVFINANISIPSTRFICVRYGNVLASRGSVVPLFREQIKNGGPVTITTTDMTRFLLSLDKAVDTVIASIENAYPGEIYIPKVPSARILDVATALIEDRNIETIITGIRPGEKVHEILVSYEESQHTVDRGIYYAIQPMLPELLPYITKRNMLHKEYSSGDSVLNLEDTKQLLYDHKLNIDAPFNYEGEFLR